jgi:hypothetical protein
VTGEDKGCLIKELRRPSMETILLVVLILLIFGLLPTWPYSRGWGYYPSGIVAIILIIIILMVLL